MIRFSIACLALWFAAQVSATELKRSFTQPFQQEYGYAAVVQHGDTLYLSGIAAPGKDMAAQLKHVYTLLDKTLQAHGSSMAHVINERVSTTDIAALTALNAVRKSYYPEGAYPASSWYQIERLFADDALIEIEVVAKVMPAAQ